MKACISAILENYIVKRKACRIDAERFLFSDLRKKIRGAGWLARFCDFAFAAGQSESGGGKHRRAGNGGGAGKSQSLSGLLAGVQNRLCLLHLLFGAAFTIMAFHNDIGIREVFGQIYELLTGQEPQSVTALEIAYSIGLALGILVFFNHIGGRRITSDPTPIEVEMRKYETDVNQALTETADREKRRWTSERGGKL